MAGLEELLYRELMKSAAFHRFVRSIHAKINGLPNPRVQDYRMKHNASTGHYLPTASHKLNAFRILFKEEFGKSIGLRRR